jgi:hypothetical protein
MSKNNHFISLITSASVAAALWIGASPAMAQRPAQEAPPPPPPPARPQNPTPPPPPPPQTSRDQQQREANARAQQQEQLRAQQEQQRIENARQQQEQKRIENARDQQERERIEKARQKDTQERIEKARQTAAAASADHREIIGQLIGAERQHREQLARINRLKELAKRQGQNDRIGELDRLLLSSNSNFESKLSSAKTKLTQPEYNNTVAMLEQGRRREVRQMMGMNTGGGEGAGTSGAASVEATRTRAPEAARAREAAPVAAQPPR